MRYEPLFRGPNNLTIEDVAKKDQSEQNEQSLTHDSNTLYIQEPSSDLKMFGKRRTYSFFLYFLLVIFTVIIEAGKHFSSASWVILHVFFSPYYFFLNQCFGIIH